MGVVGASVEDGIVEIVVPEARVRTWGCNVAVDGPVPVGSDRGRDVEPAPGIYLLVHQPPDDRPVSQQSTTETPAIETATTVHTIHDRAASLQGRLDAHTLPAEGGREPCNVGWVDRRSFPKPSTGSWKKPHDGCSAQRPVLVSSMIHYTPPGKHDAAWRRLHQHRTMDATQQTAVGYNCA